MRVGIDASNIRASGAVTHLMEVLRVADPPAVGCREVIVWGGKAVLQSIDDRQWLRKIPQRLLEQAADPYRDRGHLQRAYWQRFRLPRLLVKEQCDLLFVPGGMDNSGFHPLVTMSQNMLVFEPVEARRFGWSMIRVRLQILRLLQSRTFRRADGMIFLTRYARDMVTSSVRLSSQQSAIIPHGVGHKFCCPPRQQRPIGEYSAGRPYRIVYVSTVMPYKHQWHVVEAVVRLRAAGFPITLDLVGTGPPADVLRLRQKLAELDDSSAAVRYVGMVPYDELHAVYAGADMKVFASSCENLPIILLEAMAAGLPIACSRLGPMPEVLGDAGVYFDPQSPEQIRGAIEELLLSPQLRARNAARAFELAQQYSWQRCARETFEFLVKCAQG